MFDGIASILVLRSRGRFRILDYRSSDHFIGSYQYIGRNCQTELLGRLQVDDELELARLLQWVVRGRVSLENFVQRCCDAKF